MPNSLYSTYLMFIFSSSYTTRIVYNQDGKYILTLQQKVILVRQMISLDFE
jgi:hypothetical protein